MSGTHPETVVVPRAVLIAAAALITFSVGAAGAARLFGVASAVPVSTAVASVDVRFADQPDKSVVARDAATGQVLATYAPGTNGFLRATMRGLVGDRGRVVGREAPDVPFRVVSWADGRLSLQDPMTGRDLELEAFGITNEASFAALLPGRTVHASAKDMPMGMDLPAGTRTR